jgi:hypothetical protein
VERGKETHIILSLGGFCFVDSAARSIAIAGSSLNLDNHLRNAFGLGPYLLEESKAEIELY